MWDQLADELAERFHRPPAASDRVSLWVGLALGVWAVAAGATGMFSPTPPSLPGPRADPAAIAVGYAVWVGLVLAAVIVVAATGGLGVHQLRRGTLGTTARVATATRVAAATAMTIAVCVVALWAGYPALVALAIQGPR